MTCSELRKYIFNNILKDRQHEYQSTDNIGKILVSMYDYDEALKYL